MCETRLKWELSRERFGRNLSLIARKYENIASSMSQENDFHVELEVGFSADEAPNEKLNGFFASFFSRIGDRSNFGQNQDILSAFPDEGEISADEFESDVDEPTNELDEAVETKLSICQASCELTQFSCLSNCGRSFVECVSLTHEEHDSPPKNSDETRALCLPRHDLYIKPPVFDSVEILLPGLGNVKLPLSPPKTICVKFKVPKGIIDLLHLQYPTTDDVLSRFYYYERHGMANGDEGKVKLTDTLKPLVQKHLIDINFAFLLENTSLLDYQRLYAVDSSAADFVDFTIELDQTQQKALASLKVKEIPF